MNEKNSTSMTTTTTTTVSHVNIQILFFSFFLFSLLLFLDFFDLDLLKLTDDDDDDDDDGFGFAQNKFLNYERRRRRSKQRRRREEFKERCDNAQVDPIDLTHLNEDDVFGSRKYCLHRGQTKNPKTRATATAAADATSTKNPACYEALHSEANERNVKPFYNKHRGETAAMFCSSNGQSVDLWKAKNDRARNNHSNNHNSSAHIRRKRVIQIGVNDEAMNDKKRLRDPLDYYFLGNNSIQYNSVVESMEADAKQFQFVGWAEPVCKNSLLPLVKDIGSYNFGGSCSSIFAALQFILYTGVKQLFVVGCEEINNKDQLNMWREAMYWTREEYPCAKIAIIKPSKALKGKGFFEINDDDDDDDDEFFIGL